MNFDRSAVSLSLNMGYVDNIKQSLGRSSQDGASNIGLVVSDKIFFFFGPRALLN